MNVRPPGAPRAAWAVVVAGVFVCTLACAPPPALHVFAASSLAEAFETLARDFERAHPGERVRLNLAGSQQLAFQIEQSGVADVFASADTRVMERVRGHLAGNPEVFAVNTLAVIAPAAGATRVEGLADLARPGVRLVVGAEAVPVGAYARQLFDRLSHATSFDSSYVRRVLANIASEEENVKAVVARVRLGEADAGVCYRSDLTPAVQRDVRVLEIPADAQVVVNLEIAVLAGAPRPRLARAFVRHVQSGDGRRVLARHGFAPPGGDAS